MFGEKGQEAAPFELLIAVIIMGFVLLAGIQVIEILRQEECKGKLDSQMEEIKSAIESVASAEGQKTFSFFLPDCFNRGEDGDGKKKSRLRVLPKSDSRVCSAHCRDTRNECMLLWFATDDYHNIKCLKISTVTNFPDENDPGNICNDFRDSEIEYNPTNLMVGSEETIEDGQYTLVRKFQLDSHSADICAYKKVI